MENYKIFIEYVDEKLFSDIRYISKFFKHLNYDIEDYNLETFNKKSKQIKDNFNNYVNKEIIKKNSKIENVGV
jgi:hypothetical protein